MTVTSAPSRPRASAHGLDTLGREGLRTPSISESSGATAMLNILVARGSPSVSVLSRQTFGAGSWYQQAATSAS
eukprot:1730114-Prorocentrum_lima.AAC.1